MSSISSLIWYFVLCTCGLALGWLCVTLVVELSESTTGTELEQFFQDNLKPEIQKRLQNEGR